MADHGVWIGLFEMEDGTVVYARAMGNNDPHDDVVIAWNYLGWANILPTSPAV